MADRGTTGRTFLRLVLLFTGSGAVGLLYEVAWVRRLTLVFGNTTYATSATLAIFFLGLAVGAALAGRWGAGLRRPFTTYGLLEVGLGLYAAATPWLFDAALPVYRALYQAAPDARFLLLGTQLVLCALVLGPPTCAMGATLPILSAGVARRTDALSARIGWLYGWNTAGAALGTLATGFLLLGRVGVMRSIWTGAVLSVSIGALALRMARTADPPRAEPLPAPARPGPAVAPAHARLVLAVMALSGALGLAYEVTWTRLIVYTLGSTAYAFTLMLVTYLVGLALGGLAASRLLRRRRASLALLGWTELGIGLATAASLLVLVWLPEWKRAAQGSPVLDTALGVHGFHFIQCVLVMLVPALLLGATFPLAVDLLSPAAGHAARTVGRVYGWNTLGGVVGSLLAGFVAVPLLGTVDLLRLGIAINAALALVLLSARRTAPRWWCVPLGVAAAGVVAVVGLRHVSLVPLLITAEFGSVIEYQDEGITGTVTIHRYPETGVRVLSINGCNVAGTTLPLLTTQKMQGHVPALLHGHATRAMQIGFGSGETAKTLTLHGVDTVHGVEISPEVIRAGDHLAELNGQVAYSSRFHPIIMDAVNYARLTDRMYDLILNDSIYPGLAGSSALYTRDHFAACAARLNPGGIFSCWLPLDVPPDMFRTILAALTDVFPYTQLWLGTNCDNKHALLTGSLQPLRIDLDAWAEQLARPAVQQDLHAIRIADAPTLAGFLLVDADGMRALAQGAPPNTHDRPRVEYAPHTRLGWRSRWRINLEAILAVRAAPGSLLAADAPLDPNARAQLQTAHHANTLFLSGLVQELGNHPIQAKRFYERTLAQVPGHRGAQYTLARMRTGIAQAERSSSADDADPDALWRLAEGYWRGGEPEQAIEILQRLLQTHPQHADGEELLVVCALAVGAPELAEPVIDRIRARHPEDPTWAYNRALVHELRGRLDEAAAGYAALLAADATYRPARLALAQIRLRREEYAESERLLLEDREGGEDARWYHLLALAYLGQGRTDEARAAALTALAMAPDSRETRDLVQFLAGQELEPGVSSG